MNDHFFANAVKFVFAQEGGYTVDSGGPTNYGVTKRFLESIGNDKHPSELTRQEALEIYKKYFWTDMHLGHMAPPLNMVLFDTMVNCGRSRTTKWLQEIVGAEVDGYLGPKTLMHIDTCKDMSRLIAMICAKRLAHYTSLKYSWVEYGRGWSRRVAALMQEAFCPEDK